MEGENRHSPGAEDQDPVPCLQSAIVDQRPQAINPAVVREAASTRSEEHTSELQSLMRISYAVFCLKKKHKNNIHNTTQRKHLKNKKNTTLRPHTQTEQVT